MQSLTLAALCAGGAAAVCALTAAVRRYALRANLLDHPNARSSHQQPTPRGGGVAIVAAFLALAVALGLSGQIAPRLGLALAASGVLIAVLGFADDRAPIPARWRFLGHAAAAVWGLACIGRLPPLPAFGWNLDLGPAVYFGAAVFTLWSINLFNFMDGIDGIASLEAIGVALGGALVWWLTDPAGDWPMALLFAACVAGFLVWNFPPARIFMGDAGSGFLGLIVALLALWSSRNAAPLFWSWLILAGCFWVDATLTLVQRVRRGERFYEAHRSHAYQYAARIHGSHRRVSLTVLAINTLWLLPWAVAVALHLLDGLLATLIAYAPLVWLGLRYKAGDRAAQGAAA